MAGNVWQKSAKLLKLLSVLLRKDIKSNNKSIVCFNQLVDCLSTCCHKMAKPLKFSRLSENAFPPTKGSERSAGYDLYSAYDYVVPKRGKQMVKTDICVAIPEGCYGRIAPRSGLAWKHSIDVGAGVVDEDYRGNVCVILFNFSDNDFSVSKGDRIAQLICERIANTQLIEIDGQLDETLRQANGFGSTGVSIEMNGKQPIESN